jgi:hypothetical protein
LKWAHPAPSTRQVWKEGQIRSSKQQYRDQRHAAGAADRSAQCTKFADAKHGFQPFHGALLYDPLYGGCTQDITFLAGQKENIVLAATIAPVIDRGRLFEKGCLYNPSFQRLPMAARCGLG